MAIYMKCVAAKAGEIKGGVTAKGFQSWIAVTSIEFGYKRAMEMNAPTGAPVVSEVRITKHVDKASVLLANAGMVGDVSKVTFSYIKEGVDHGTYLRVELKDAIVSQYDHLTFGEGSNVEKVSLSFSSMEYTWVDGGIVAVIDLTKG